jgi:hypothetical protein
MEQLKAGWFGGFCGFICCFIWLVCVLVVVFFGVILAWDVCFSDGHKPAAAAAATTAPSPAAPAATPANPLNFHRYYLDYRHDLVVLDYGGRRHVLVRLEGTEAVAGVKLGDYPIPQAEARP